jgi:hypothetical protein
VRILSYRLWAGVAAVTLTACGGSGSAPTPASRDLENTLSHSRTFRYDGGEQRFMVPAGVGSIAVNAIAAAGGGQAGGLGGRVNAVIAVTPGEALDIYVGGKGSGSSGGFNGGGNGGMSGSQVNGSGGGGASDVRRGLRLIDRILVAGGAGGDAGTGGNGTAGGAGGGGGPRVGGAGIWGGSYASGGGGGGGRQNIGGHGGRAGYNGLSGQRGERGKFGEGGDGGAGAGYRSGLAGGGGGAGGGYYGGGGGGGGGTDSFVGGSGGGGGGGSSYVEKSATRVHMLRAWKDATGNGLVVFRW